jgi:RNA polymerase sigma-70 factor (ECF subfamily)
VIREFQGRLRAFIASFCPDRDLTDEIDQVTFVWAYEHLNEYRPGTRFYAWLRSIARNRLLAELEELQRRARNRKTYLEYLQAKAYRDRLQIEDSKQQTELVDALRSWLEKLPGRSRSLIKRRYEGQESLSAIASPCNIHIPITAILHSAMSCCSPFPVLSS